MTEKIGVQPYLGIHINYEKENLLNSFSKETITDRYLWEGETHAQQAFARAAIFGATYKGHTDFNLGQRLYEYASNHWFSFSTPILSNGGTSRGLPISCFLNYVPDSRDGLSAHYDENIWLASGGGGIGGHWGDIRSNGVDTSNGSRSTGSIPFMHVVDSQMLAFNQGVTRRGSYAAYINISHPEVEEFINMRKTTGGDLNRKCLNLHNAINITNEFLVVTNKHDKSGLIKLGNERVVEARLSDAEFFWQKDKSQNLVKRVSSLKSMNYFKGLGTYFDKVQRMRKLGGMLSDELLISKDKVELSASICKVDLVSELVGEFPELQGIMGGYFAEAQGFEKDVCKAISEQYLPAGLNSKVPKKPYSVALSLADKIDTLVGFFGINQKPTSSKDPFALRRLALGVIKTIVENKKYFKIRDLISYSTGLYLDQGFEFENKSLQNELISFLMDRLKFYMKEEKIRSDIILASTSSFNLDRSVVIFGKAKSLNKFVNKPNGIDLISSYKRASNILESELKDKNLELSNTTDPGIFKNDYEKNLFKKINELRKYFSSINKDENYKETLIVLASAKKVISDFFDNVKVNDEDKNIKKNRLELLQMLCRTFNNYINFSNIETK